MADIKRETRRVDLKRRLRNAEARKRRAEADIEEIEGELSWMDTEDDLELIRSWRGKPDWPALLEGNRTTCRYMLANFFVERMGLRTHGLWSDTGQMSIGFSVPISDDPALANDAVARRQRAVEVIASFIVPAKETGAVRFHVFGKDVDGFALELRLSPDFARISLVKMVWGHVREEIPFATLGEALIHIQAEYPGHDISEEWVPQPEDAPGETGDALRAALDAFFDGCRSAGIPIEHPGFKPLPGAGSVAA